jgi:hypothetical protein
VKILTQPNTGLKFKMGRNRPVARGPRLSLRNYVRQRYAIVNVTPPSSGDWLTAAMASIRQVYLNDQLGDCVIAGVEHIDGVLTGNVGAPSIFTDAQTTATYSAVGGYVPGDPSTDNGCDEQTALNYWTQHGLANGSKIAGWMAVDPDNAVLALDLFENLMFGVELPNAWIEPFPGTDGFVWDVAGDPDPGNGHCFVAGAWEPGRKKIATWGMTGFITDAAIEKYATTAGQGEMYTVLSQEQVSKASARAPNALDWQQLEQDFAAMGGLLATAR